MASRRATLIALAALLTAPLAFQKIQATLGPLIKGVPLMTIHEKPIKVGDFEFRDESGVSRSLANYRDEFVLVNVWATWCPPCRKEMPSLDRLAKEFVGNPNIKVIAISVDRTSIAQVRAFYSATGIERLPLLHGSEEEVLSALQIAGLPTTILLDRRGLEIGRLYGPTAWDNTAMIEQLSNLVGTE